MHSIVNLGILLFLAITVVTIHGKSVGSGEKTSDSRSESSEENKCGKDEEYNACGSACPVNCSNVFYPMQNKGCTKQCVAGCFCKSGLYRAKDGRCVKLEDCCQGKNEYYTKCGTACPETCTYKPNICTEQCVEGCFCKANYIRRGSAVNSDCIKRQQCYT